jgi:formylglycine-generating enzyme required for sulfatase activity
MPNRLFNDKKIDNNSFLFIWYSGYAQPKDDEDFLLPVDSPLVGDPDFKQKTFRVRDFEDLSKQTKAKHVYMVFDSCFSYTVFSNEISESPEMSVASMKKYPVRQYLCSCSSDEKIKADSVFREKFIKALRNEVNANANGDNYLTASELGAFIKREMAALHNKVCTPRFGRRSDDKGEFFFLIQNKFPNYFSDILKDGSKGPEMSTIPGGYFNMGDLQGGVLKDEKPVHGISVLIIAVSRREITFAEYDLFCEKTVRQKPDDNGWGRSNRPVIFVSWEDSVDYTKWLSEQTGFTYRLPTEAEWEYFARAGTDTNYWWGNEAKWGNAAWYGWSFQWGRYAEKKTAPVGSFNPNPFGIYDTVGNVWEWTCSEYTDEYNDSMKETKCLEKITTGREVVVLRGGSWDEEPKNCRVSYRKAGYPGERSPFIGFRVVRELK